MTFELTRTELAQIYINGIASTPAIGDNEPVPTKYIELAAACVVEAIKLVCLKNAIELPDAVREFDRNIQ